MDQPAPPAPVAAGSPRLRRLAAEFESLRADYSGHPHVRIEPVGVVRPPERYRISYVGIRGVVRCDPATGVPELAERHEVEVILPLSFPREGPLVRPLTPLFHPNIDAEAFCMQDHWAAGQQLTDLVAKVADMIQYREYNVRSPLDIRAARWASANAAALPVGDVEVGLPDIEIGLGSS